MPQYSSKSSSKGKVKQEKLIINRKKDSFLKSKKLMNGEGKFINPFNSIDVFIKNWFSLAKEASIEDILYGDYSGYYDKWFNELSREEKEYDVSIRIKNIIDKIDKMRYGKNGNMIDIYRSVVIFNKNRTEMNTKEIKDLFLKDYKEKIGVYWSWDWECTSPWWEEIDPGEDEFAYTVQIDGGVNIKDIDWGNTILQNLTPEFSKREREITVIEGKPIKVYNIDIYEYDQLAPNKIGGRLGEEKLMKEEEDFISD